MAKKIFKKTERYITERISAKGTHSLEICIRHKSGQTFRKSILISDFETPKQAMEFAKQFRDEKLSQMNMGMTVKTVYTVKDLYEKSFELIPVRIKTLAVNNF